MGNSIQPIIIPSASSDDEAPDPFSYVPLVPLSQKLTPPPTSPTPTRIAKSKKSKQLSRKKKAIKKDYQQLSIKRYLVKKSPVTGPSKIPLKGPDASAETLKGSDGNANVLDAQPTPWSNADMFEEHYDNAVEESDVDLFEEDNAIVVEKDNGIVVEEDNALMVEKDNGIVVEEDNADMVEDAEETQMTRPPRRRC